MRNKDFEMYKIEMVTKESSGKKVMQIRMSKWSKKNVIEDEYVVMKVVEEMVKSKVISLVDELFLECKSHAWNEGQGDKIGNNNNYRSQSQSGSRRAYWDGSGLAL